MSLNTIILIVGIVLFLIGFLMRGSAKANTAVGVISMFFMTAGAAALIYCLAQWIGTSFTGWQDYSDKF
ncbi:MAG: hypothetical protein Q4E70_03510 [Candidatus Saccharibacteria bacterium]|nr:hypothetical protein [Candidatus Saccharibacteria bacterium]